MADQEPVSPGWRLLAGIYPFAAGAVAVNLYFASLIGSWIGLPVITPTAAAMAGLVFGWPAAWPFARHFARLMREADG
ncbi:NnrT protein [Histidinibacterium aquaticum]|uniref:NnrT protein n=1 Tax=Histidinibacterium aquaticum TaxID=2613962 RepID=A0A5J5GPV7_9RHOB|nr:NnrT protein [Histidinibacterium aquaticum]KAA9010087.1 NnrT protein [Histidinibacterium aquaticum]